MGRRSWDGVAMQVALAWDLSESVQRFPWKQMIHTDAAVEEAGALDLMRLCSCRVFCLLYLSVTTRLLLLGKQAGWLSSELAVRVLLPKVMAGGDEVGISSMLVIVA